MRDSSRPPAMRRAKRPAPEHRVTRTVSGACATDQHGDHFHEPLVQVTLNYETARRLVTGRISASLSTAIDAVCGEIEERELKRGE